MSWHSCLNCDVLRSDRGLVWAAAALPTLLLLINLPCVVMMLWETVAPPPPFCCETNFAPVLTQLIWRLSFEANISMVSRQWWVKMGAVLQYKSMGGGWRNPSAVEKSLQWWWHKPYWHVWNFFVFPIDVILFLLAFIHLTRAMLSLTWMAHHCHQHDPVPFNLYL